MGPSVHDAVETYPPRYIEDRLVSRRASAREIRSQLLVLVHMVDSDSIDARTPRLPWLTEEQIQQRVENRDIRLREVEMHRAIQGVVHDLYSLRMLDADRGAYRINKLGILHMWSHSTRLRRHNAHNWEQTQGA